jgi:hypothetical protein
MKNYFSSSLLLLALQLLGCTVDVQPTDNGLTINVQCGADTPDEQPTDEQPTDEQASDEELSTDDTSGPGEPATDEPGVDAPSTTDPGNEDPQL